MITYFLIIPPIFIILLLATIYIYDLDEKYNNEEENDL